MIVRNFFINIGLRLLIIISASVVIGYSFTSGLPAAVTVFCLLLVILFTINLIIYLDRTNKKIAYFFDAVRNDDSNLSFPTDAGNKTLSGLFKSMKRVNDQIQQLKIENIRHEQYFKTLIEHLATGIITYNNKGFILHSNSAARKLISADVLTHIKQIERLNLKLYNAVTVIKPFEKRLVASAPGKGDTQLSLKATSLKTSDEELTILSIQDINSELDEKELDSWLRLIKVLMHEIMNSITPITSLSESLTSILSKDGKPLLRGEIEDKMILKTIQGLNVIKEQGKGLMSFVESYRKLSRVPDPDKKLFHISELINRVRILYRSLEKSDKVELKIHLADPSIEIFADENLISQVMINLLKNALEANDSNSSAQIRITACIDSDNHPEICVIDNGPGIPGENLEEIFVPFYTTRANGSGIGLSISRQIMRVHGGTLKVSSVPGKETIFRLTF